MSCLQTAAARLERMNDPAEVETVLAEMEYRFEDIPPGPQEPGEQPIERLRDKPGRRRG